MERSFEGGLKLKQFREFALSGDRAFLPSRVILRSSPSHGTAVPLVTVGQTVFVGQIIAETSDGYPMYSSVSGVVDSVSAGDNDGETIVVVSDDQFRQDPSAGPVRGKLSELSPESIREMILRSAVTGSGDGRHLYERMAEVGHHCARLVVNICDSSPYSAVNRYLASEKAREISGGTRILFRAMSADDCWFALGSESKPSAGEFRRYAGRSGRFSVSLMENKYPQGNDRLLRTEFSDRTSGVDATDVFVVSAEECVALYSYFSEGLPMTKKIVTVDGDCLGEPQTMEIPLGSNVPEVIRFCDPKCDPGLVILGDLMTGRVITGENIPVEAETDCLLSFRHGFGKESSRVANCINCGRCISVCPAGLWPNRILRLTEEGRPEKAASCLTSPCLRCGLCTYVCPSGTDPAAAVFHAEEWSTTERDMKDAGAASEEAVVPMADGSSSENGSCTNCLEETQNREKEGAPVEERSDLTGGPIPEITEEEPAETGTMPEKTSQAFDTGARENDSDVQSTSEVTGEEKNDGAVE